MTALLRCRRVMRRYERRARAVHSRTHPRSLTLTLSLQMLRKYDTDGTISNLIEMEKENPEAMLESDELKEVESGAVDIRCSVCHAASKVAYNRAAKRRLLLDEEGLTTLVYNELCYGTPLDMVEKEYPKYPGNPPLWGELYQV